MASQTIMIIRHAEKPDKHGPHGDNIDGKEDKESLTPLGWQRTGAWVALFMPALGQQSAVPLPATIFASNPTDGDESDDESEDDDSEDNDGSKSRRPLETITPLAAMLGLQVDLDFEKGQEAALGAALSTIEGVTLVCWQHQEIAAIANALVPAPNGVPSHWPHKRFNVIYRFDRSASGSWVFTQVVPIMLAGDSSDPIAA